MPRRPDPTEYAPYYEAYVHLVDEEDDLAEILARQIDETLGAYRSVTEEHSRTRYAPGKWSMKQVLGHIGDTERVFQYRAAAFGRGDASALPSMEQDTWMATSGFDERSWTSLIDDLKAIRASSVALFRHLPDTALDRRGIASGNAVSVRALGYMIAGHERHHLSIFKERYGLREK